MNDMTNMDGLESTYTPILVGHLWARPKEGPWGGHESPVAVVDVRDGWVRYAFPNHGTDRSLNDFRKPEGEFRKSFEWIGDGIDANDPEQKVA
jgi:hypothetical protein